MREDDLEHAILEVLQHAAHYFKGDLSKFSLIIQEYITPDIAGIAFTRSPNGGREMVMEYGYCEGALVVGGMTKPYSVSRYWDSPPSPRLPKIFLSLGIFENFQEIERKFGNPQDIEWCIRESTFYILQTRPITTITEPQYAQILYLEHALQKYKRYYFEKTEVSEIAPRPTPLTLDLLRAIYAANGPVDKVYRKYRVHYSDTDFLRIIGNELYVDREREIKTLLPSYSYLNSPKITPRLGLSAGIFTTLRNLFFLNVVKINDYEGLFHRVKEKLEEAPIEMSLHDAVKRFLTDYETIFDINLLSGVSMKRLLALLGKEGISIPDIIGSRTLFTDLKDYDVRCPQGLYGNSLELSDASAFIASPYEERRPLHSIGRWWQNIPAYKRKAFAGPIARVIIYARLRELGRWLTVKNMNAVRDSVIAYAKEKGFKDEKNILFAGLADITNSEVHESDCQNLRNEYEKFHSFTLPSRIVFLRHAEDKRMQGVSSGVARGVLCNRDAIAREARHGDKPILYTEALSPDLTAYFDNISGIASRHGGLLSHLAIMARECKIPVVVGFFLPAAAYSSVIRCKLTGEMGLL